MYQSYTRLLSSTQTKLVVKLFLNANTQLLTAWNMSSISFFSTRYDN